jgi:hypothetical protein
MGFGFLEKKCIPVLGHKMLNKSLEYLEEAPIGPRWDILIIHKNKHNKLEHVKYISIHDFILHVFFQKEKPFVGHSWKISECLLTILKTGKEEESSTCLSYTNHR